MKQRTTDLMIPYKNQPANYCIYRHLLLYKLSKVYLYLRLHLRPAGKRSSNPPRISQTGGLVAETPPRTSQTGQFVVNRCRFPNLNFLAAFCQSITRWGPSTLPKTSRSGRLVVKTTPRTS